MLVGETQSSVQHRLAQHYLKRLQAANSSIQRGEASRAYWMDQIEQDWAQIHHWQAWSAQAAPYDREAALLCVEFPIVGADFLTIRQSPEESLRWLETALALSSEVSSATTQCMILRLLYRTCFHINALDKAEGYIVQLHNIACANREYLYEGCSLYALGFIAEEGGNYPQAEDYYRRSLSIFCDTGDATQQVHALYGLACVAKYRGEYHEAHAYFLECLSIAERLGMENEIGTVLSALSGTMTSLKDLDAAERYARRGVELCQAVGHRRLLSACLRTLGNTEFEQGHREAALLSYEQSYAIASAGAYQRSAVITLHQWGCTHFSLGMHDQALEKFKLALELSSKSKQPHFVFMAQRELANTYLVLDQLTRAEEALREALLLTQVLQSDAPKSKAILTGMAWAYQTQKYETATALAGVLMGNPHIDASIFEALCAQLKAVLGDAQFEIALTERRHCPSLEEAINHILEVMHQDIRVIP